ncbi:MAG: dTDP-glucose 4,6-dehydratase [Myxococcota bacterium]|nr:dTDP-glucose 4,6-dehydratase [Myxococcota bacterium]
MSSNVISPGATLLVTGAAGFIGSNFVRMLHERGEDRIVALDKLTYAGNLENLEGLDGSSRYTFVRMDICDADGVAALIREHRIDAIVHFAAESHVDRSILGAAEFIRTNVEGTRILLDIARGQGVRRFLQVSTDEVYGSLPEDRPEVKFTEQTPLQPNSPYSASKASADLLVRAWNHTYGLDTVITRCSNNYGPYQFPEKLIPLMIANALEDKPLPVYGDGQQRRDWIHVRDHCRAIDLALRRGRSGEVYNVGGDNELPNLTVIEDILSILGKPRTLIRYVEDRKGHDRRYSIDGSFIAAELGYRPQVEWKTGLRETIQWYVNNRGWWERIRSGAYRDYYEKQYAGRLSGGQ